MEKNHSDRTQEIALVIPDFADDPDSISTPELFFEDDGIYVNCCHCGGSGYLYGNSGWICPECDGSGIGGMR
ncbi:hypothetical protein [Nostoc sp. CMAA1605]|uniref:hypothetical protein n=1 Tax=Nostoc sp. CMAA1605 TaxID=2055159 RepID=UPI001F2B4D53|nr:hypothetical protein [Nostoc sp. CMAA1605]MCF4967173.1 hypothetical protein [Nostoc sp. CMAA1605]